MASDPTRQDERGTGCGHPLGEDPAWPGDDGLPVCQACWEAACDRSWWEALDALTEPFIPAGGAVNAEGPDGDSPLAPDCVLIERTLEDPRG